MHKTYISKKGYVLKKETFSKEILENVKKELTAKPLSSDSFITVSKDFPVYIETVNNLYIPKMYGINNFGQPMTKLKNYQGKQWTENHDFTGNLLQRQILPYNTLLKACRDKGGGLLQLNAGSGKTFITVKILSELKCKSIIIVNKIPLMNQWAEEISNLLPTIKIGFLQGQSKVDVFDCDIVVAMLQSMSRIDYPDELFNEFRAVVFDEVHNFSSACFSKILFKVCCPYSIALSATPQRSDGCDYIINWHVGDIVYKGNVERIGLHPKLHTIKIRSTEYTEVKTYNSFQRKEILQFTSMISHLINMTSRNELIVNYIKKYANESRKILVLSERRDHLYTLKEMLENDSKVNFTFGLFLGKMKEKELAHTKTCNVLLATFKAFSEGINEKDLDTLFLITPKKYIGHLPNSTKKENGTLDQIVGRIFRKPHLVIQPVIVDFSDHFSVYKSQANSRKIFYNSHFQKLDLLDTDYNIDTNECTDKIVVHQNTNEICLLD